MSKASAVAGDLVTRPLSSEEILIRQEEARPATKLVGDLNGQAIELAPTPTHAPRVIEKAAEQIID